MTPLQQKLIGAFDSEQRLLLSSLRSYVMKCEETGQSLDSRSLDEALRMAHTLKGAARVIDLAAIVQMAHHMESFFANARSKKIAIDRESARILLKVLDLLEDLISKFIQQNEWTTDLQTRSSEGLASLEVLMQKNTSSSSTSSSISSSVSDSNQPKVETQTKSETQTKVETETKAEIKAKAETQTRAQKKTENKTKTETQEEASSLNRSDFEMIRVKADSLDHLLSTADELSILLQRQQDKSYKRLIWQLRKEIQQIRMLPVEFILQGLAPMIRDLAHEQGKEVEVRIYGQEVEADKVVVQALRAPLIHMLRNCISHGLESTQERKSSGKKPEGRVSLHFSTVGDTLRIEVEDDGRGLNWKSIQRTAMSRGLIREEDSPSRRELAEIIFHPGFSTTSEVNEVSGRGMGLSVVRETLLQLRGNIESDLSDRVGAKFVLSVPMKTTLERLILCQSQKELYAIPFSGIERVMLIEKSDLKTIEGNTCLLINESPVRVVSLASLLAKDESSANRQDKKVAILILKSRLRESFQKVAMTVDRFVGEGEFLIKGLGQIHEKNSLLLGSVLLESGTVTLVLNPSRLLERFNSVQNVRNFLSPTENESVVETKDESARRILVVDDSITTRTLEKGILEANGFQVELAVDGEDGLRKLHFQEFHLVISDIEMPIMDGLTLLSEIKKDPKLSKLPVIMVTSKDSLQDQQKGFALGADRYLVKQKFDQSILLETIRTLI